MPSLRSFLLLLHLGCFALSSLHPSRGRHHRQFKKKLSPPKKSLFSFLKILFTSPKRTHISHPIHSIPSPSSSTRSLRPNPPPSLLIPADYDAPDHFAAGIHPCPLCGEVFQTPILLDHHRSARHAVEELGDGENIVRIIFKMGWPDGPGSRPPAVHRVLKVHNSPKTVARFEEYRESVKSSAAAKIRSAATLRDERCIADGNEMLRFYCTTFVCGLDGGVCGQPYCGACGIIRGGFSHKMDDGIATLRTSWRAHAAVQEDFEEEFGFMKIKRAMLVCRVIAGRVGSGEPGKKDPAGFDSVEGGGFGDELVVLNPRAVLPCFVIVYTV